MAGKLRIYCICGQKMKVTPAMYGKPGKCVACRMRIRVPTAEEIPDGVDEIYLKDHPEFIRKRRVGAGEGPAQSGKAPPDKADRPKRVAAAQAASADAGKGKASRKTPVAAEEPAKAASGEQSAEARQEEAAGAPPAEQAAEAPEPGQAARERAPDEAAQEHVALGADDERVEAAPLTVWDAHRRICSIEHKLRQEQDKLKKAEAAPGGKADTVRMAQLNAYLKDVEEARTNYEEELRRQLLEAARELTALEKELSELAVSARMGETEFGHYLEQASKLRARREQLVRLEENLRGWLVVQDPYLAGGYEEVPWGAAFSNAMKAAPLPRERWPETGLLDAYLEKLRTALAERERAERKLDQAQKLIAGGGVSGNGLKRLKAETSAAKVRADALVKFYRQRVGVLQRDYSHDLTVAETHQDLLKARHDKGAITPRQYRNVGNLVRSKRKELARSRDLAIRAQAANNVQDVPRLQGGALARRTGYALGREVWIVWLAAGLLLLAPLLPLFGQMSALAAFRHYAGDGDWVRWAIAGPAALALLAALVSLLPSSRGRRVCYLFGATVATLAAAFYLHNGSYRATALGETLLSTRPWVHLPAVLCFAAAIAALLLAGWRARPRNAPWHGEWTYALLGIGGALLIATDAAGLFAPAPRIEYRVGSQVMRAGGPPQFEVILTVSNAGRRGFVMSGPQLGRGAYQLAVERAADGGSYVPVEELDWRLPGASEQRTTTVAGAPPQVWVGPGDSVQLACRLAPGVYRARMIGRRPELERLVSFELARTALGADAGTDAGRTRPDEPGERADDNGPEAELVGIVTGGDRDPQFTITLHHEDGSSERVRAELGTNLPGGWVVTEFNPSQGTVTLRRDDSLLILRRGEGPVPLEGPAPEE